MPTGWIIAPGLKSYSVKQDKGSFVGIYAVRCIYRFELYHYLSGLKCKSSIVLRRNSL
jgi:hypothetical protein